MKFLRIFLLVLIIIGIGLLVTQNIWVPKLVNHILQKEGLPIINSSSTIIASQQYGFIEGKLGYPASISPFQIVCAANINETRKVCTTELDIVEKTATCGLSDWQNHIGEVVPGEINDCKVGVKSYLSYKLKVPVGEYNVYSSLADGVNKLNDSKAYYSEFVTCGLNVKCKSHKPIVVSVEKNKTVSGIDPVDWYANN